MSVKVMEVSRRVLGEEHPGTLLSMGNLADLYQQQQKYAEAEALMLKTLEASRRVLGEEHPDTLRVMSNLGTLYQYQDKFDEAEPLFVKTLEARRRVQGNKHADTAGLLGLLALLYLQQGRPAEAEPLARECLTIRQERTPDHWALFSARSVLGGSLAGQQKFEEAEPLLLEGYRGMKQRGNTVPKRRLKQALERLVGLYEAWEKPEEVVKWKTELDSLNAAPAEEKPESDKEETPGDE